MLKDCALSFCARLLFPFVWLAWAVGAPAHTLPISYLTLVPDENYLHLELTLNPFELVFFSELDIYRDGRLDPAEWQRHGEKTAWRILDNIQVRVDGRLITPEIAGLAQSYESHHLIVGAHYAVDVRQAAVSVESKLSEITSGAHLMQVSFGNSSHMQAARLDGQSNLARFEPLEKPITLPAAARTPAEQIGVVGQHELVVVLLLTCIVSVLLLSMGSVALLVRHLRTMNAKAPFAQPQLATQLQQIP